MMDFEYAKDVNLKLEMMNIKTIEELIFSMLSLNENIYPTVAEHQKRVAIISYYMAKRYHFSKQKMSVLILSALLHDIGYLGPDDRHTFVDAAITNDNQHADLGAKMLESKSLQKVAKIIQFHHIDNRVYESKKNVIPMESLLISFANQVEFIFDSKEIAIKQKDKFVKFINDRNHYYPDSFFSFLRSLESDIEFWYDLDSLTLKEIFKWIDMNDIIEDANHDTLEEFTHIYSKIIDFRSKYTVSHSSSVASIAYLLARSFGVFESKCSEIKLAGYMHDIGKIIVPIELLEKNAKLTESEYEKIKLTEYYTRKIINSIKGFDRISAWINEHNELSNVDGTENNAIELQIMFSANIIAALCEEKAYRKGFPIETVRDIIQTELKPKISSSLFEIIENKLESFYSLKANLHSSVSKKLNEIYDFS